MTKINKNTHIHWELSDKIVQYRQNIKEIETEANVLIRTLDSHLEEGEMKEEIIDIMYEQISNLGELQSKLIWMNRNLNDYFDKHEKPINLKNVEVRK